jgi:hypothetical protein
MKKINYRQKCFITLGPGVNVIKLILSIIYDFFVKAREFVPYKLFQSIATNAVA